MSKCYVLFCLFLGFEMTGLAQPPSVVYHPDQWHFSWCERLADGRFFGPVWDASECRTMDANMHQVASWVYVDPLGGLPVIYNGVHNGPSIVGFGVVRHQQVPGQTRTKMSFTRVTATGELIDQKAFFFDGNYQEYMAAGGSANVKIATNPLGDSFLQLRLFEGESESFHILKVAFDGTPIWQVRFPADYYIAGPLEADLQGGCWFTTAAHIGAGTNFQIGRLDANGEVVFWNSYHRPGATYRTHSTVRGNGDLGHIAVGIDNNRIYWMRTNNDGAALGYRLTSELEPPNVFDNVGGVVRVGQEWAVLQGVAHDRLVFFDLNGVFRRAYLDSVYTVNDTLHKWAWNTLDGRNGWAMLSGYRGLHASDWSTYEYRATLTQLKEEEWDHCLTQPTTVTQELLPPGSIVVQPLTGITHVSLPEVAPGDLIVELLPPFPETLLCAPYISTGTMERAPGGVRAMNTVVGHGEPFMVLADRPGTVRLRDMLGRPVQPAIVASTEQVQVPTHGLSAGAYLLVFTDGAGQVTLSQKVAVLE